LFAPSPLPATLPPVRDAVTRPGVLRPEVGRLNVIAAEHLAVRTGPSVAYRASATLDKGATVLVNELSPDGKWARVLTAEGVTGFVEADGLRRRTDAD
ncbi:MAG: SH3 domain-containing protein, partial [Caenispirillum bisanense]|nr:SH3 domain-containing protein [Caenispirillum bisanense]MCA1974383.1 SH3 domain-containing protein [Caenispirillum sp.]